MNAQDLKNSILQLAIQGKLVEQRPEEGTAKELIDKIKEEKKRLIKEKKIKKETLLTELTEKDIPFDIPLNWDWVKLGEIVSVNGGKRIPVGRALTDENTGYKYIRVADMKNGSILLDDIKYIPRDIYSKIKKYTISKNDIYITVAGTIGQVGLVPEELHNANLTENADKLVIYSNFKEFMYYMLSSNFIQYQIKECTTKVGQPKLAIKRIKELKVPLPPLKEQKRIVAKIEELIPFVDKYDAAYSELEELNKKFPEDMQKSILQYAIQGKLVEQQEEEGTAEELYNQIQEEKKKLIKEGKIQKTKALPEITEDEIPFDIPENWKWVRFDDIFEINPRNNVSDEIEVSFIPMVLIKDGYISEFTYEVRPWGNVKKGYTHFQDGDIVMAKITPCFQNLKSALMMKLYNGIGAGTTELHVLRTHSNIIREFYLWFIKSPVFISTCVKNMTGTAGQKRVPTVVLRNFVAPLPPLKEQKRIVAKIEELMPYTKQLVK